MPDGFWVDTRFAQGAGGLTPEQRAAMAELATIGYADGYEDAPIERGVLVHEPGAPEPGANLYSSGHAPEARLIDLDGEELHRWTLPYSELPDAPELEHPSQNAWRRIHLLPDGGLLAIHEGLVLVRLTRDSEPLWSWPHGAHHDLALDAAGRIAVLGRSPRLIPELNAEQPLLEDRVAVLSPEGEELSTVSVYGALARSAWAPLLERAAQRGGDVLHTNSIEWVTPELAQRLPGVETGQVLLCLRELPALATLDLETRRITWLLTGAWGAPHDPTPLDDGRLLLFDNMGHQGYSRVLELDPRDGGVRWSHHGEPPESFFSLFCGAARRQRGGTTLITLSCAGRALEVTREGRVVWSFASPHRTGPEDALVAVLFEVERIAPSRLEWLDTGPR